MAETLRLFSDPRAFMLLNVMLHWQARVLQRVMFDSTARCDFSISFYRDKLPVHELAHRVTLHETTVCTEATPKSTPVLCAARSRWHAHITHLLLVWLTPAMFTHSCMRACIPV